MTSCFKKNQKLVGISNFLVWKRRIDIVLEVNEVINHVHGKVSKPSEEQASSKYMERDLKAQKILKESIKDPLISYVAELDTSKQIYNKLGELFSKATIEKIISLISDHHKMKVSKDEGIFSCLSKASQIKAKSQDRGEMVSDNEMIFVILNALNDEQGNLISTEEEEAIPFIKLWSLYKAEEDRMKKESDKRSDRRDQLVTRRKGKFGKFGTPKKKRKNMAKERCYG